MFVMHELEADQASWLWAHGRNAECDTAINDVEKTTAMLPEREDLGIYEFMSRKQIQFKP